MSRKARVKLRGTLQRRRGRPPPNWNRPNPLQTRQVQQRGLLLWQVLQILLFDHLKLHPPDPLDITFQNRDP